jgi:hypothetical protein
VSTPENFISDPNLLPEDTCYWRAVLYNDEIVIQDDSLKPVSSTWIRLGDHLIDLAGKLSWSKMYSRPLIKQLSFHFRTNSYTLPIGRGYYLTNGILQLVNFFKKSMTYYVAGYIINDVVKIEWVKIPELVVINRLERPLEKCKRPALIL